MAKRRKKVKQKGRFARFSGATTKHAVRVDIAIVHHTEEKTSLKELHIPVGPIKFPPHVVNTGRGPEPGRMQQYYNTVKPESFEKPIPIRTGKQMEVWLAQFQRIIRETPMTNRLILAETSQGILALFYSRIAWFFVEADYATETIKRSRDYSTKAVAMDRLANNRISWIEELSSKSLPPPDGR